MPSQSEPSGIEGLRRVAALASACAVLLLGALAPSADANYVYVVNRESASVSVIDTETNRTIGPPIGVGAYPGGLAISPDGRRVYVASGSNGVSVIETETNQVTQPPIPFTEQPTQIAITPDGVTAYMTNVFAESVSALDLQLNQQAGPAIPVESEPGGIVISPDGRTAYVLRGTAGRTGLTVLDTWTNQIVTSIPLGPFPNDIAISSDGRTVYVTDSSGDPYSRGIWVIDTATNQVTTRIPVAEPPFPGGPGAIAISPGGGIYVAGPGNSVHVSDAATNEVTGSPIPLETYPGDIAITPDGKTLYVSSYFTNSVSAVDTRTGKLVGGPIPVGTGPGPIAISEDLPSVRVSCPKGAASGCRIDLQAMTKRRSGRAQSSVTNVKLRSRRPRLIPLRPRRGFAGRIANSKRLLVKETVDVGGKRRTTYRSLKVFRPAQPGGR
jgi:YVTN family beta-propeller protein